MWLVHRPVLGLWFELGKISSRVWLKTLPFSEFLYTWQTRLNREAKTYWRRVMKICMEKANRTWSDSYLLANKTRLIAKFHCRSVTDFPVWPYYHHYQQLSKFEWQTYELMRRCGMSAFVTPSLASLYWSGMKMSDPAMFLVSHPPSSDYSFVELHSNSTKSTPFIKLVSIIPIRCMLIIR